MRNTLSLVSIALLLLAASVVSAQVVTGTMGSENKDAIAQGATSSPFGGAMTRPAVGVEVQLLSQ